MVLDAVRIRDVAVIRDAGWEVGRSMQTDDRDRRAAGGEDARRVLADNQLSNAQGCAWESHDCRAGDLGTSMDPHGHLHEGCIGGIRRKELVDRG